MKLAPRLWSALSTQVDRVVDSAASWARNTPMAYRIRNRNQFTDLRGHEVMLADHDRVDAYAQALPRIIGPSDDVLDLGTGTGVLAFLAARAGARTVHAVEHSEIIRIAERVAEANGMSNVVFHQTHSRSLDLPEPVDVLVHEQMGNALFEERMVSNVADLRDRVLKPGGAIVPARFQFFVEPVALRSPYAVPWIWQQSVGGIDYAVLRDELDRQPPGYRRLEMHPDRFDRPLTTAEPVLHIDLGTANPADLPTTLAFERVVDRDGTVDGLAVWFRAELDEKASIDTTPFDRVFSSWQTPLLRLEEPLAVTAGTRLRIRLQAESLEALDTWRWSVRPADERSPA